MLIHLSKSITYAIHALYYMSYYMKDRPIMARELCDAFDFPYDSMLKILRQMTKDKILMSHRGSKGGFTMRKSIEDINLFVLIESIEGPIEIIDPLPDEVGDEKLRKITNKILVNLTGNYREMLKNITCDSLFRARNGEQILNLPELSAVTDSEDSGMVLEVNELDSRK